jgi:ACS family glucarate transporter-like MFS transporter
MDSSHNKLTDGLAATDVLRAADQPTNVRWIIVVMLFLVTAVNYADRAALSIAGPALSGELHINPAQMGFIFSAFSWSYTLCQIPGGWAYDRFGSKVVYGISILFWSIFTLLQGFTGFLTGFGAIALLFALRFLMGAAEAPALPGNSRIVAAWFPDSQRGRAVAIFNSAQYFSTAAFIPIMGWLTHSYGWPAVFFSMGGLGILVVLAWLKVIHSPRSHPWANQQEIDFISKGGGLVDMDTQVAGKDKDKASSINFRDIGFLFSNRMMVGLFIGQYGISVLTWFFLTWFPIYLVQARGMSILKAGFIAALPALCGFLGGILGGVVSDALLKRGYSLSVARKLPIVTGMVLAMCMMGCNYTESSTLVVILMMLAFFGKGFGALGWTVLSDTAPRQITGLAGGVFNMCGNISGIVTPLVIGFIVNNTHSFNGALVFVGANALIAALAFIVVVGDIKRLELKR